MKENRVGSTFPFIVADTVREPVIQWDGDSLELILEYTDYQNCARRLVFANVLHFSWLHDSTVEREDLSYDGVTFINDSKLLNAIQLSQALSKSESEKLKHLVLGFNGSDSYFEIVYQPWEESSV